MVTVAPDLRSRPMTSSDLASIIRIEVEAFPEPWKAEIWRSWVTRTDGVAMVVESRERICGYFVVAIERSRCHVLNLAVGLPFRRQGVGRFVVEQVERLARTRGRVRIDLEVQETNLGAQLFYRELGFRAVEILRGYYPREDGYLMRKVLEPDAAEAP